MMLAVMLVVILIGFALIQAWPSKPTQQKRRRETDLVFKLKELRKALRTAILTESKLPNEERVITALIYGPDKISYKFDRNDTNEDLVNARRAKMYDYLAGKYGTAEITIGARSSPEEIENVLIRELRERRYLRADYKVPLLDGSIIDTKQGFVKDVRVAWRIAENLLASSSFEEGYAENPMTMEQLQDFNNYRQYWFSKSGEYDYLHATTTMEPPPYDDFDGEKTVTWHDLPDTENEVSRQTRVSSGKYGSRVLILKNP